MNQRMTIGRWIWALAAIAGCAVNANAQYRRGGDGRLLERDLGVYNSGGLAGRDLTSSFRFAQNVSFGRAGGGFSFMGNLGTQDYSDFVGGLGSNDLRDFRNRTQGSALAGRGVRASDTASYVQSLTSGTRRPNAFRGSFELPSSTYSKSFEFDTNPDYTGMSMVANANTGRRRASGLLTDPLRTADERSQRSLGASGGRSLPSMSDSLGSTRLSAGSSVRSDLGSDPLTRTSRPDTLSGSLTGSGLETRGLGAAGVPTGDSGRPKSLEESRRSTEWARRSMREAEKTRATAAPDRLDTSIDTSIDTSVSGRSAAMQRPSNATPALPSATSYDRLLERLDKLSTQPPGAEDKPVDPTIPNFPSPSRPGPSTSPGRPDSKTPGVTGRLDELRTRLNRGGTFDTDTDTTASARVKPVTGLVGGSDWLTRKSTTLSESGAVLSTSERAARDAARVRAQRSVTVTGQSPEPNDPNAPRGIPELDPETLRVIREAGGLVDSYLPADATSRDPFSEHVNAGIKAMSEGQYFTADDRFTSAANIRPSELTAQFGRIHAQIGGATFKAAANNLRRVLRTRPEVAALRYDAKLMPDAERMSEVVTRLRGLWEGQGQTARDAALLGAYVGFQTQKKELQTEALARLEALASPDEPDSDPRDALLARFLRSVWAEAAAPKDAEAPKPPEASPEGKGGK